MNSMYGVDVHYRNIDMSNVPIWCRRYLVEASTMKAAEEKLRAFLTKEGYSVISLSVWELEEPSLGIWAQEAAL